MIYILRDLSYFSQARFLQGLRQRRVFVSPLSVEEDEFLKGLRQAKDVLMTSYKEIQIRHKRRLRDSFKEKMFCLEIQIKIPDSAVKKKNIISAQAFKGNGTVFS